MYEKLLFTLFLLFICLDVLGACLKKKIIKKTAENAQTLQT